MPKSPNRRNNIPPKELATLWGASAGRCNICNTSLLIDATTGVRVKAGEMAHIVGVSDGPRSPRGQDPLSKKDRDLAENLILLCEKHHTEVDDRLDIYTVDHLRSRKHRFEERVFFLTGLDPDRKTLVLRVIATIHGSKVPDIGQEEVREVVLREQGRYPRFDLSSTAQDAAVDLRQLTNEGTAGYWIEARTQIARALQLLQNMQSGGTGAHVSVFGLARIPVLVMLGDELGDADEITVYHRRNDGGWGWDPQADLPAFELVQHGADLITDAVTLVCSLTATVQIERAPAEITSAPIVEIRPVGREPGHTVLDHPESLEVFARAYREFLSAIEQHAPETINVLPAVPADAAVTLGRIRTPAANPPLRIYDLDRATGRYEFACEVGR